MGWRVGVVGALGLGLWIVVECNVPWLARVAVPVRDLVAPVRLLHLSDLHGQAFGPVPNGLTRAVAAAGPVDALMITGDLVDDRTPDLRPTLALLAELRRGIPRTFYVPGNHEHWAGVVPALGAALAAQGVTVLRNARTTWRVRDGVTIDVVGVDDAFSHHDDAPAAVKGLDPARCAILLTHAPELVDQPFPLPVDLVLAGHTHGGQVRIPFVGALVAPGQGFFPRWDKGLYDLPGGARLHVDSGVGTSVVPVRLFDPSQVSVLALVPG